MVKDIKNIIEESIEVLVRANNELIEKEIDLRLTEKFFSNKYLISDIRDCEIVTEIAQLKKDVKNPVLYWFELTNNDKNEQIRNSYANYRNPLKKDFKNSNYRNTAAYKTTYWKDSITLYVGKVETGFWGRLITHLGYSTSVKTAGMQLFHWYNLKEYGELTLKYVVFKPEIKHLLPALEKKLALIKQPLIGIY